MIALLKIPQSLCSGEIIEVTPLNADAKGQAVYAKAIGKYGQEIVWCRGVGIEDRSSVYKKRGVFKLLGRDKEYVFGDPRPGGSLQS